ncbi:MAG: protein kinase domain-containing protein [Candidatus Eiseniibacteriota bacterium]
MRLAVGNRLGPYEIRAALGAGGMGEVYRARDTKLHRDVALKILPEPFATDPDRLARFQREAQLLASVNHPQIASIYGFEEADGVRALVLELVEGPTLADRIAQGPLPLDEALPVARQITEALDAAHAVGIIHRDLKPANIKLRPDGAVKVLDFGLAKALEPASRDADSSQSPTMTSPAMTQMGVILGTAAYMSPEQAKGRAADKRSDIWAFGCVLFEMLTGHRAFQGEDVADTLALVLRSEPAWGLLPPGTPPSIRRLLRRGLEKDRKRRLADAADARLELEESATESAAAGAAVEPPRSSWRISVRNGFLWAAAGALLATSIWFARGMLVEETPDDTSVIRSSILLPGRLGSRWGGTLGPNLALSPDGRRLAFVATDASGRHQLWLRDLDGTAARPLPDTDEGTSPFWSPDGRWLAFVAGGRLRKLNPSGGPAVTLCESALAGGTWSRDDVILFTHSGTQTLAQVHAAGGAPSLLTELESEEYRHANPYFLPDGRHFLYVTIGLMEQVAVYVASLDSQERTRLSVDAEFVQVAGGSLLFVRGSTLMAQPFDERRRALVGAAVPISEHLRMDYSWRGRYFSVSPAGLLVFQEDPSPGFELVWFDREGRRLGTLGEPTDYMDVSLSPDGGRALVSIGEPGTTNRDLWIFDVARGLRTRFTTSPAAETHSIWSPDGSRIVFDSMRKGHRDMYQKAANGTGDEELLFEDEFDKNPVSWSPDGRSILYIRRNAGTVNLWVLPLEGDRKPFPFRESPFFEVPGAFSPDGRWVAYGSTESGRTEIYVSPFPGPGEKVQVSPGGGFNPKWRRGGNEIFYLSPDNKLMVASVVASAERFHVGEVKPLFELPKVGPRITHDVSADGQRVLAVMRKPEAGSSPLTLVINWPALLRD